MASSKVMPTRIEKFLVSKVGLISSYSAHRAA